MQEESINKRPIILITGASGDLGIELVKQSVQQNWKVVAVTKTISKLQDRLPIEYFNEIDVCEIDLSVVRSPKDFKQLLKYTFNYVVLNAGILIKKDFHDFTVEELNKQFNVNFFSNVYLLQSLIPQNIDNKNNHIIAVGSMSGIENSAKFKQMTMYGASKSALHNIMQTLAAEYQNKNIVFNTIAFGAIKTQMLEKAFGKINEAVLPSQAAKFILNFATHGKKVVNGKKLKCENISKTRALV